MLLLRERWNLKEEQGERVLWVELWPHQNSYIKTLNSTPTPCISECDCVLEMGAFNGGKLKYWLGPNPK